MLITTIFAESKENLEKLIQEIDRILKNVYYMSINRKKTKVMLCVRNNNGWREIETSKKMCYPRSTVTEDGRSKGETSKRFPKQKESSTVKKPVLFPIVSLSAKKNLSKHIYRVYYIDVNARSSQLEKKQIGILCHVVL